MSLINEALKKAQKQREDEAAARAGSVLPPGLGRAGANPPSPPPPPPRAPAGAAAASLFREPAGRPDPLLQARQDRGGVDAGALVRRWGPIGAVVVVVALGGWWWTGKGQGTETAPAAVSVVGVSPLSPVASAPSDEVAGEATSVATDVASEVQAPLSASMEGEGAKVAATGAGPAVAEVVRMTLPDPTTVPVVREESTAVVASALPPIRDAPVVPRPLATGSATLAVAVRPVVPEPAAISYPGADNPASSENEVADNSRVMRSAPTGSVTILADAEAKPSAFVAGRAATAKTVEANEAVLAFLERARVTGVRVSASDPKVLMNDRVYRLNEVVDRDLKLRVIAIRDRELQFRDPAGYVYTKTF